MKNVNIIKKNYDFQKIIATKRSVKVQQFFVYFKESEDHFRYGISVGKKLGIAVLRNKVKRQVRVMVREILPEVKSRPFQIVIIVRNNFFNCSYENNLNQLRQLLMSLTKPKEKRLN